MATPEQVAVFRRAFSALADIPESEWRRFFLLVRERRFGAREHLVWEGRPDATIHFILSGLVRLYYNEDGDELVQGFDMENRFVTAYESVLTGGPALFSVQALEPTHTMAFDGNALRSMYEQHPCWDRFGRRILEAQWLRQTDKARRFRVYTPEEHYRLLIARGSPIIDRVPLNQLASFLRIAPETLSRIRARIRDEEASRTLST